MLPLFRTTVTPQLLADWLETQALFCQETISEENLAGYLEEESELLELKAFDRSNYAIPETEAEVQEEVALEQEVREEEADLPDSSVHSEITFEELARREFVVGARYPFEVNSVLSPAVDTWREARVYAFLLMLNFRYFSAPGGRASAIQPARLFERLVVPALRRYWGGRAEHFGWPRTEAEKSKRNFPSALAAIRRLMTESEGADPTQIDPARWKDIGVDVIAWRPLDGVAGQSVLLCQCAIGKDWEDKGLHVDEWRVLINFAVPPARALAFPFVASSVRPYSSLDWQLLCARVGIPFDRVRLASLINEWDVDDQLLNRIETWTNSQIPKLHC